MHGSKTILGHYYNKHETRNPILRVFVNSYKRNFRTIIGELTFDSVVEIGSGEGYIISYLLEVAKPRLVVASDIDIGIMCQGSWRGVLAEKLVCKGEHLPILNRFFDLVLACEVLEHVESPREIVREIARVSKKWVFVTVPYEPYWRILNIMRGKYIGDFGNTPGHLGHFSVEGIVNLLSESFSIYLLRIVFPWIFVLCETIR